MITVRECQYDEVKKFREIVGLVSLVDAEGGDVVAVAPVSKKEGLKGGCELPVTQNVLAKQDLSGAVVSADALDTQDDTARIVLEQGGDYVLQVKANQRSVARQCETKAYLAGDPVDADFPGVTMVIRTFRRTWKVV